MVFWCVHWCWWKGKSGKEMYSCWSLLFYNGFSWVETGLVFVYLISGYWYFSVSLILVERKTWKKCVCVGYHWIENLLGSFVSLKNNEGWKENTEISLRKESILLEFLAFFLIFLVLGDLNGALSHIMKSLHNIVYWKCWKREFQI